MKRASPQLFPPYLNCNCCEAAKGGKRGQEQDFNGSGERGEERENELKNGNWKTSAAIFCRTNTECPLGAHAVLGPGDRAVSKTDRGCASGTDVLVRKYG